MDKFQEKDFIEGDKLIAKFMGHDVSEHGIETKDGGHYSFYEGKVFSQVKYHSSWDWIFTVINKIHDLEEEYPVVKNNFHILIAKRFTRVVYDWDAHCDHDKASETKEGFKKFQESSKDYRHTIFENNSLYSTWHAIVDFINWWNKQQNK